MVKYQKNIGHKNRAARLAAGIVLVAAGALSFNGQPIIAAASVMLGVILLLEAASSCCIIHGLRGTKDMR